MQSHFTPSKLFAPLLESERRKRANLDSKGQQKRRRNPNEGEVKLGHGGTLDPLATGVLIVGVGKGTRELASFLGCKKTYETVVLFGKGTDTYDVAGKIVASAPYEHVTKELVEEMLSNFRGKIKQAPPMYSALKLNGIKAYEYARSGKELPKELAPRDMEVAECTILEWFEGGTHQYRWPAGEAPKEEKEAASTLIQDTLSTDEEVPSESRKRKTSLVSEAATEPEVKRAKTEENDQPAPPSTSNSATPKFSSERMPHSSTQPTTIITHIHAPPPPSSTPSPAPACSVSLTVSSGFYVRSFAHDLGLACSSLGIMASLVRSRQGDFALDPSPTPTPTATPSTDTSNAARPPYGVLSYTDLALGEDHWAPKITAMLDRWNADHRDTPDLDDNEGKPRIDDRDRDHYPRSGDRDRWDRRRERESVRGFGAKRGFDSKSSGRDSGHRRDRGQGHHGSGRRWERRNTSSGEE